MTVYVLSTAVSQILRFKRGYIQGTSISWSADITIFTGGIYGHDLSMSMLSNTLWVTTRDYDAGAWRICAWYSNDGGDSWTARHDGAIASGWPDITPTMMEPLDENDMLMVTRKSQTDALWYNTYISGSWATISQFETGVSGSADAFRLVSDEAGGAHLVYLSSDDRLLYKYFDMVDYWTIGETEIENATVTYFTASMSSMGRFEVYYVKDGLIYHRCLSDEGWSERDTPFGTSFDNPRWLSTSDMMVNPLPVLWTEGTSSPYTVKFCYYGYLAPTPSGAEIEEWETVYDPILLDWEHWIFVNKRYTFTANYTYLDGWEFIDECRLKFNDTRKDFEVLYDNQGGTWSIVQGEDYISLNQYVSSAQNLSSTVLEVKFSLMLNEEIFDCRDRDIWLKASENMTGSTSAWTKIEDSYFNIYNLGGFVYYNFDGSASRSSGGGPYEMEVGDIYVPSDIFEDNFEGSYFRPEWSEFEFLPNNTIGIMSYPYLEDYDDFHSAYITDGSDVINPYLILNYENRSEDFSLQIYNQHSSNAQGFSRIYVLDEFENTIIVIYFGYGSDYDGVYSNDNDETVYLDELYGSFTWYNLTLSIDVDSFTFDVYWDGSLTNGTSLSFWNSTEPYNRVPAKLKVLSNYGNGPRTTYIDAVKLWSEYSGGYTGTAQAMIVYRYLQHSHLGFSIKLPECDFNLDPGATDTVSYTFYVEIVMDYVYNGSWNEGWKCRLEVIDGESTGLKQWVYLNVRWFYKEVQISSRPIYVWWEGVDGSQDQFSIHSDLWFSIANFSTTWAGRVSPVYYGVEETTNAIYRFIWGEVWGIMGQENDKSSAEGDLSNNLEEYLSARDFPLSRLRLKLVKSNNNEYQIQLIDFDKREFRTASGVMVGINTPVYITPIMPKQSGGGLLSAFWALLSQIGQAIASGLAPFAYWLVHNVIPLILDMWNNAMLWLAETIVPLLDAFLYTIFPALGPTAFTNFLNAMNSIFVAFASFLAWLVDGLGYILSMLTQVFLWLQATIGYLIWIFIRVIDIWIQFWTFLIGFFTGAYNTGINIWQDWQGETWATVAIILYPVYIFYRCVVDDSFDPLIWHVERWKDIFAFLFNLFHVIFTIVLTVVHFIIEAIPVVE